MVLGSLGWPLALAVLDGGGSFQVKLGSIASLKVTGNTYKNI
jgi:hypothetical protein